MARPLDEILADFEKVYFEKDNLPREKLEDVIRRKLPKYLRTAENDLFFEFLSKLFTYERKISLYLWILEYQFSVLTAKGKFLDNLGRWLGLSRPPLPVKRTNKPVVIFPNENLPDLEDFNQLHGLSANIDESDIPEAERQYTHNTFFPTKYFIGETLVNDDEYRVYILGLLKLKQGLSLKTIIYVFTTILIKPFFITRRDANLIQFTASYDEYTTRLTIVRDITAKLRTTGFDIEVIQAKSLHPPEIEAIYGVDCYLQDNPYLKDNAVEDN